MGCFGYMCKGCGTSIRGNCWNGGEKCILIHVRHGEELGRIEGHYDEYGRVIEQKELPEKEKFRGHHDGVNGHRNIHTSEFGFNDSAGIERKRLINGVPTCWSSYSLERQLGDLRNKAFDSNWIKISEDFEAFPYAPREMKSGIAAWHSKCYHKAADAERDDLIPSEHDPDQSWGKVRREFT